jgi:hypothetical protein
MTKLFFNSKFQSSHYTCPHSWSTLSACCTGCFSLWNSFRLRMMLLCSVDLLYYSLLGLALYHFVGEYNLFTIFLELITLILSRSMVYWPSNRWPFRCCFSLGHCNARNLPTIRYATSHGNDPSKEILFIKFWLSSFASLVLVLSVSIYSLSAHRAFIVTPNSSQAHVCMNLFLTDAFEFVPFT